jgi:F-type H+-transporting ATPase subunit b
VNIFEYFTSYGAVQTDAGGGLFDFNATLPFMDLQLILVISVLTLIFYQPLDFVLNQRERRLTTSLIVSSRGLAKATELYVLYRRNLTELLSNGIYSCEQVEGTESKMFSAKLTSFLNHTSMLLNLFKSMVSRPNISSET